MKLALRPSPSMAVASTALFVSLGGVSYGLATGSIGTREIRDNSLRGKDVRDKSLTGKDFKNRSFEGSKIKRDRVGGNAVKEQGLDASKFRKVPSAASADSATNADSAASLGGLRVLPISHRSGDIANATVFEAGGLRLLVTCAATDEELRATTTMAGGEIAVISDDALAADGDASSVNHNLDDDFGPGDDFDLADVATAADDRIYQLHYIGGDGTNVSAQIITDDDLGTDSCIVGGHAVVH